MNTSTERFITDCSKGDDPLVLFRYAHKKAREELYDYKRELFEKYEKILLENIDKTRRFNKINKEYEKKDDALHEEYEELIDKILILLNMEESIDKLTYKRSFVLNKDVKE